jgi:hypothetical protein
MPEAGVECHTLGVRRFDGPGFILHRLLGTIIARWEATGTVGTATS